MSDIEMKAKFRDWFTTKAPKQFKEMFDKTTVDEGILLEVCFHQFAEMVANDVRASDKQCNLPVVNGWRLFQNEAPPLNKEIEVAELGYPMKRKITIAELQFFKWNNYCWREV